MVAKSSLCSVLFPNLLRVTVAPCSLVVFRTVVATCDDGNGNIVFTKPIEYTDFPLDKISLWFANNVIYLPSEH